MARLACAYFTIAKGQNVDKTIMGLLGGVSALALLGGGQASAAPSGEANGLAPARSFAELLDPIPDAANVLRAEDERAAADALVNERPIVVAQYHHHHHHHYYHHHHHYHHHYHHHHHYYHNG
jgi:hypothetical protein